MIDEKILELCGFKFRNTELVILPYRYPDGSKHFDLPTIDLSFLFKYAEPLLDGYAMHRYALDERQHYVGLYKDGQHYSAHNKDVVEAWKQALIKLIKEEKC